MDKMNVAEAAEFFGVSKEAIHNRIRRGSLNSEIVDGQKYVIIDESSSTSTKTVKRTSPKKLTKTNTDSKYYEFLEEQNSKLQKKVETLESETRSLRDQKEQMLIDERQKIESIYKEKDEQLKSIINMISSNLILESKAVITEDESLEAEIETLEVHTEPVVQEQWTSLNKFLKEQNYKKSKREKIYKKFCKKAKKGDKTILIKNDNCYIDLNRFGYDL